MDNEQLQIMAAKYQASLVRANANNKRYLATENGKVKSKASCKAFYELHKHEDAYIERKNEVARNYYRNNEAYREIRKKMAKEKYAAKKLSKLEDIPAI